MEQILDYYRDVINNIDDGTPFIERANNLFGFNGSSIPLDRHEKFFQRYQLQFGKSNNVIAAFDDWLENQLPMQIRNVRLEVEGDSNIEFLFDNIRIYKPYMIKRNSYTDIEEGLPPINGVVPMYPRDAMLEKKTYGCEIFVDIITKNKEFNGEYSTNVKRRDVSIGILPIIKGCKYCWLKDMTDEEKASVDECFNDPLGYFIIDGSEKTIIASDKLRYGKMLIYKETKESSYKSISLSSHTINATITLTMSLEDKTDNMLKVFFHSNTYSIPALFLSILLHFLDNKELLDRTRTYDSIVETSKSIIKNVLIPEILEFAGNDAQVVKYRLSTIVSNTIGRLERNLTNFVEKINQGNYKQNINVIDAFCKAIYSDVSKKTNIPTIDSANIREEIAMNIFPNYDPTRNDDFIRRRKDLSRMIAVYSRYLAGKKTEDDRDSYINKEIDTCPAMMRKKFDRIFAEDVRRLKTNALKLNIKFTKEFNKLLKSGSDSDKKVFTEQLRRDTPASVYSQLQRISSNSNEKSKIRRPRYIHPTQMGYICSGETPEGQNCGVLKNFTSLCWISIPRNLTDVEDIVQDYVSSNKESDSHVPVSINGIFSGWFDSKIYLDLRKAIKTRDDMFDSSVDFNYIDNVIEINTTGYIPTRPMYKVNPETGRLLISELSDEDFEKMDVLELNRAGYIEFNSPGELNSISYARSEDSEKPWFKINEGFNYVKVAEYVKDVDLLRDAHERGERLTEQPYTHSEIIPHVQFGYSSSCVPKANLNKGPRVTYQSSMFKQALSGYHSFHTGRFDSNIKLHQFPTRTVFETSTHYPIGLNAMPTTTSPIIAITISDKNNEDALLAKREYFDNNLRYTYYSTNVIIVKNDEQFDVRPEDEGPRTHALYTRSDAPNKSLIGLPKIGTYVRKGDVFLGKYMINPDPKTGEVIFTKKFETIGLGKDGFISAVEITNEGGAKIIKVKVGQYRRQIVGDKVASRYSQKGTFGDIRSENTLPRIVGGPNDGVVPDFIFNSHSIPSRLTQGKILEILIGKDCVFTGKRVNASPFSEYLNDDYMVEIEKSLQSRGMEPSGLETLRFPDGTILESKIYVGVCAYQALKHNVADKIQARNTGGFMPLTHQPNRGKGNEGGLKIGEMERDALISHGTAECVQDRLMESSDLFKVVVCKKCGNIVPSNFDPKNLMCQYCDSKSFGVVTMPYPAHLVNRLLNVAGIHMHYKV